MSKQALDSEKALRSCTKLRSKACTGLRAKEFPSLSSDVPSVWTEYGHTLLIRSMHTGPALGYIPRYSDVRNGCCQSFLELRWTLFNK